MMSKKSDTENEKNYEIENLYVVPFRDGVEYIYQDNMSTYLLNNYELQLIEHIDLEMNLLEYSFSYTQLLNHMTNINYHNIISYEELVGTIEILDKELLDSHLFEGKRIDCTKHDFYQILNGTAKIR